MKVRVLGGGWYGCHLATALLKWGHEVQLLECSDDLFLGASGANPARLHMGFHYPRSRLTRAICQEQHREFMSIYGQFTRTIPINIYAVAQDESKVDWGNYVQVLRGEVEFVTLERPAELGLRNVEGAMLTGERHIVIDEVRAHFRRALANVAILGRESNSVALAQPSWEFDLVLDCTFCARDNIGIDRYEGCITALLEGPTDRAVTIMDGPFPSIYPWNERQDLSTLTSAKLTPVIKADSYLAAEEWIRALSADEIGRRCTAMMADMERYWPESIHQYKLVGSKLGVRALPLSGADARLVEFVRMGPHEYRVRAGKIDAVLHAEKLLKEILPTIEKRASQC